MGDEPRKLIAIRLDEKVLGWLRKTAAKKGLPYQLLWKRSWPARCERRVRTE
jgi:predicted DNA binding CopG/RHH family protein